MNFGLPAKALHALIDIKKELLSPRVVEEVEPAQTKGRDKGVPARTFSQRHARGSNAFQRGCQKHNFWTPVH